MHGLIILRLRIINHSKLLYLHSRLSLLDSGLVLDRKWKMPRTLAWAVPFPSRRSPFAFQISAFRGFDGGFSRWWSTRESSDSNREFLRKGRRRAKRLSTSSEEPLDDLRVSQ